LQRCNRGDTQQADNAKVMQQTQLSQLSQQLREFKQQRDETLGQVIVFFCVQRNPLLFQTHAYCSHSLQIEVHRRARQGDRVQDSYALPAQQDMWDRMDQGMRSHATPNSPPRG